MAKTAHTTQSKSLPKTRVVSQLVSLATSLIALAYIPQAGYAHHHHDKSDQDHKSHHKHHLSKDTIENFEQIAPGLYRGGQPPVECLADLKERGIKTIINLRMSKHKAAKEEAECKKLGIRYIQIPMSYKHPPEGVVLAFLGLVNSARYQPTFIHCRFGSDRTGTMVALYRIIVQKWSYEQAYEEMRNHHFKPFLLSLKHTVEDYAESNELEKDRLLASSRMSDIQ